MSTNANANSTSGFSTIVGMATKMLGLVDGHEPDDDDDDDGDTEAPIDPVQAAAMGASIFDVTLKYDEMALDYVRQHPHCRYIFLSSGAAYGSSFDEPVDENTKAVIAINNLQPQDWYAVAKLHAEQPSLTGNQLYDMARAITTAEYQNITYNEYLPTLLGKTALGTYHGYDPKVSTAILEEFSTAAFRFGHD